MPLRGLFLLGFVLVSIPICFMRPFYGIVLWIIFAFLNPQSFTWTFDLFPWAMAVAVPTILGMLVFDRRLYRLASREVALLGVLWVWFTVTTLVSTSHPEFVHHAAETWARWNFVTKILLMTICMIPIISTFERLRYLVLTISACFGFYVLKSLPFVIVHGGQYRLYGPERSMIGDNTDFGLALNMTLPLYFYLAQTESKPWLRKVLWFLFVITIPAIFFTYSRGAVVGLVATFMVMLLQSKRRLALIPVAAGAAVIAVSFAPEAWQWRMDLMSPKVVDNSAQSRLYAWEYARALAADYPIHGGGFATYTEELYARYWPGPVSTIYGAHSIYFQVLAEHGYVGISLYLLLILSAVTTTFQIRRRTRKLNDSTLSLYAQMFQVSLLGFLMCGVFLGRAYFDYFFTIVACITILDRLARERITLEAPVVASRPGGVPHVVPPTRLLEVRPRVPSPAGR